MSGYRPDQLTDMTWDVLASARKMLASARRILVLTGAGISAESGVPTFRGAGGLWKRFRPEELATPEAFAADPRLVWEWYLWRRKLVTECRPNAAHYALARMALQRDGVRIVTQNVDELHATAALEAAGEADPAPAMPLELHGSIFRSRCVRCGTRANDNRALPGAELPSCRACGAALRPDVVWFGEPLDPEIIDSAMTLARDAQVCLVVGTSAVVHPAAGLASITAAHGGRIIEVNPEETPLTRAADISIRAAAAATIPAIAGLDS